MAKCARLGLNWGICLVTYLFLLPSASSTCYRDSGTIAPDDIPCNSSAIGTTHCCQNYAACLTTGLCLLSLDTSINIGSCTDKTWDSSSDCFRRCPGSLGALNTLFRCDQNQWCCSSGGNTTSCCNDPGVELFNPNGVHDASLVMGGQAWAEGYKLVPVTAPAAVKAVESTGNSTNSSAPAETTAADVCPTSNSTVCPTSNRAVAKAGLGAGLGTGLPLIAALAAMAFFLYRERRINRRLRQSRQSAGVKEQDQLHQLSSDLRVWELPGRDLKRELPA